MIANGRRIEQRTALGTEQGLEDFRQHLSQCGFDPMPFDGRDPAAFVATLWEMELRLERRVEEKARGILNYPLPIPYGIAETVKGFGFYGAGSNAAHNLPLPGNPRLDEVSRNLFNEHTARLFVPQGDLQAALELFAQPSGTPARTRQSAGSAAPPAPVIPQLKYRDDACSPMAAVDRFFVELTEANPSLRPRVGNPDELASNRLGGVLKALKHRVIEPESELEAIDGAVITALNEEAVVSACLANQGGLNLVASYEAFCVKMLGVVRQSIIFSRQQKEIGRPAGWLGWPLIATSHTWENGKNQQSHQDTTFCEALLGEMNDMVRVLSGGPNSALRASIYQARGELACMVMPKRDRPCYFNRQQAEQLARDGAIVVEEVPGSEALLLIATAATSWARCCAAKRLKEA